MEEIKNSGLGYWKRESMFVDDRHRGPSFETYRKWLEERIDKDESLSNKEVNVAAEIDQIHYFASRAEEFARAALDEEEVEISFELKDAGLALESLAKSGHATYGQVIGECNRITIALEKLAKKEEDQ